MAVPRFWREAEERYNLKGVRCEVCGTILFPTRSLCPKCRHTSVGKLVPYKLSGEGVVESKTVVHSPPAGFELQSPYVLALIRLKEGPRVTAEVVDAPPESIEIGTRVQAVFRRISQEGERGVVHYGYKFVPLGTPEGKGDSARR